MTVAWIESQMVTLAKDLLSLAYQAGVPDSFWETDSRISRARHVLGWSTEQAISWAENAAEYE